LVRLSSIFSVKTSAKARPKKKAWRTGFDIKRMKMIFVTNYNNYNLILRASALESVMNWGKWANPGVAERIGGTGSLYC
jgi:hypothetical protein